MIDWRQLYPQEIHLEIAEFKTQQLMDSFSCVQYDGNVRHLATYGGVWRKGVKNTM
ncbi:MAG: hypothetical protein IKO86_02405 [Prevotella sp.]|nr:hypothetical protein [Prevotella sp.]